MGMQESGLCREERGQPGAAIRRCLAEIARCKAHIADHGPDHGAMLGLDDWFFELLILRGELDPRKIDVTGD